MKLRFLLPLILFIIITVILWRGLGLHPNQIPSPLLNKPAPDFSLTELTDNKKILSNKDLIGHVTLLNVWASWCYACAAEHGFLLALSHTQEFVILGLNYKDDSVAAAKWLHEQGNPYAAVAVDQSGDTAINWGVYGAPETFIIDKNGIVRYKQIGPITPAVWAHDLQPLIARLETQA